MTAALATAEILRPHRRRWHHEGVPVEPTDARAQQLLAEGKALRRLAHSLLAAHDADDAVQQTWLTALRDPAAGRGYLRPWSRLTLRRVATGWRRGERRRAAREREVAHAEALPDSDPALIAQQAELIAAVGAAVQALHEPLRTAVVLRFWHGLPPDAIAVRLGVERNTVRSRVQRGVEQVRARLDARYGTRAGWAAPMGAFAAGRVTAPTVAGGGGVLLLAGMLMKTKLSLGVAAVLVAAVAIPWSLAGDRPAQVPDVAGSTPSTVVAEAPPAPAPERQEVTVPAAAAPAAFDPSPVRVAPWLARIRVIDEGGAPVADAAITIRAARRVSLRGRTDHAGRTYSYRGATDQVCGTARTNLDGRTSIELDLEGCVVTADKPGFAPSREESLMHERAADAETTITLQVPLHLRGVVQRADGSPAPGARVIARATGFVAGQRGQSAAPDPVLTDVEGSFDLLAGEGSYQVRAELEGARTFNEHVFVRRGTDTRVVLAFPGARRITGEVVDAAGKPMANADVHLWPESIPDPAQPSDERGFASTDAEGRFGFDVRRLSRYRLVAVAPPHANSEPLWAETTAEQPHAFVRLRLQAFATIRGSVRRQSGPPLPGVSVFGQAETDLVERLAGSRSGRGVIGLRQSAVTDAEGRFELSVQPGVPWNVAASASGGTFNPRLGAAKGVLPGGAAIEIVVPDGLLTACTVRGRIVRTADQSPVTGFRLQLALQEPAKEAFMHRAKAEITGNEFVLTDLPVGYRYLLQVERDTPTFDGPWSPTRMTFFTTAAGADVQVRVPDWGELPVRLVPAEGENLLGITWNLSEDFLPRMHLPGSVDANGRGAREHIVPGDYQLSVQRNLTRIHQRNVTVLPGLNAELEVRLPRTPERR